MCVFVWYHFMNDELKTMRTAAVITYFMVILQHFPEVTTENKKIAGKVLVLWYRYKPNTSPIQRRNSLIAYLTNYALKWIS
jgi:hypothetical protein